MVILYAARHRLPAPALARWLLGLGIAATLTANMAQGWSHGQTGAAVAAWPAVSLVGSYELLLWLIRTSGAVEREPTVEHRCEYMTCRAEVRAPASAVDNEQHSRSGRDPSDQGGKPEGQPVGHPATPANAQHSDEVPEADADNYAALASGFRLG